MLSERLELRISERMMDRLREGARLRQVFQEILHRYLHIGRHDLGLRVFDTFARVMEGRVLPITMREMEAARRMAESPGRVSARDLLHAAVMLEHGLRDIVSADHDFDGIEGLRRLSLKPFTP